MGGTAPAKPIIAASLDIGTNTILMTIAELYSAFDDGTQATVPQQSGDSHLRFNDVSVRTILDEHRIARLGEGVDQTGIISNDAIQRACRIIDDYRAVADSLSVTVRLAVGTSVFRSAHNGNEVSHMIGERWGAHVKILSGQEEAELSFCGTVPDGRRSAVLDIGGGSTELTVGEHSNILAHKSIELGAVRLAERYWKTFPASSAALVDAWHTALEQLSPFAELPHAESVYAVAGTPTTLALMAQGIQEYNWQRTDGFLLLRSTVERLWHEIATATLPELRQMRGVHPHRADILPAGTLLLRAVMEVCNLESVTVSARGLRYGVLVKFALNHRHVFENTHNT